jgi:hypothetical protein
LLSEKGFVNDRHHPLVVDLKPLASGQSISMLMLGNWNVNEIALEELHQKIVSSIPSTLNVD